MYYRLLIQFEPSLNTFVQLTNILGVNPAEAAELTDENIPSSWTYEVNNNDPDLYFDFISHFLDLLKPNFPALEALDIKRSDISVWMLYAYDQQCNMEFNPGQMKRLGEQGTTLCISCWQNDTTSG